MVNQSKRIYFKADGSFFPIITWVSGLSGLIIITLDDLNTLIVTSLLWTVISYFFQVLKFPKILLTNESLSIIYHPYFCPKKFIYELHEINKIELYYNYRNLRYHTTEIYISVDNIEKTHTLGLANKTALDLFDNLNILGLNIRIVDACK